MLLVFFVIKKRSPYFNVSLDKYQAYRFAMMGGHHPGHRGEYEKFFVRVDFKALSQQYPSVPFYTLTSMEQVKLNVFGGENPRDEQLWGRDVLEQLPQAANLSINAQEVQICWRGRIPATVMDVVSYNGEVICPLVQFMEELGQPMIDYHETDPVQYDLE